MIRIGVALPNYGTLAEPETLLRAARQAEAAGIDSVWVSDHLVAPLQVKSVYPYDPSPQPRAADLTNLTRFYDPLATLAFLAGATSHVRLGVSVYVVPLRNPVVTANTVASIDALSGGRVIFGAGTGWLAEEFAAMQVPFADRGPRTDAYLRMCKACWTEDVVTFNDPFYSAPPLRCEPKPAQRPHPPIWIGGNGMASMRRCVRLGDGWHPIDLSPAELAEKVKVLRALCMHGGREPEALTVSLRTSLRFREHDDEGSLPLHGTCEKIREVIAAYEAAGLHYLVLGLPRHAQLEELLRDLERIQRDILS
jgi:probable F420-dependent oxidoreductase